MKASGKTGSNGVQVSDNVEKRFEPDIYIYIYYYYYYSTIVDSVWHVSVYSKTKITDIPRCLQRDSNSRFHFLVVLNCKAIVVERRTLPSHSYVSGTITIQVLFLSHVISSEMKEYGINPSLYTGKYPYILRSSRRVYSWVLFVSQHKQLLLP